jgi:phosphatidylserine/phosphatidylglycerophosphate/cardiolipin synthase-like enzyme
MKPEVRVICNCDDAVIFWSIDAPIANSFGFQVERERRLADGSVQRRPIDNRTGFKQDDPQSGDHKPSNVWPFQRFWWADHEVNSGDTVRYRVTPMLFDSGILVEQVSNRSDWTPWATLSGDSGDKMSAFFNRGLVISQFMARYLERLRVDNQLETLSDALKLFKKNLDKHDDKIRRFLGGALRDRMLELLESARKDKKHVYGALYELDDDELVTALEKLKSRGHIVLANGSIQKGKNETSEEARKRDQNSKARKRLKDAGLEVFKRALSPGALGHNKFLVFASNAATPKAQAAWTGSTNWTKTGLCTQTNNGFLVENAAFAAEYLAQWKRLRDAASTFPASLVTANSKAHKVSVGQSSAHIWFTRASSKVDLAAIDDVIKNAQHGVLFLMFQPGGAGTLGTIRKMLEKPAGRYIKGVVSTLPPDNVEDEAHADVSVHNDGVSHRVSFDVVQPTGVAKPFASWAATVTRQEFLSGAGKIGFAIVHSKLIVVDPFTRPIVITGSHNFSTAASNKNDENFVIVRGNERLARAYAAHILSVYHHYRWMAHVAAKQKQGKNPQGFLREDDTWQAGQLNGAARKELDFWFS